MTLMAPTLPEAKPTCADPKWLEIVDAAFDRPGGPAGAMLAKRACPGCPVRLACLQFALENGEHGSWGGTSPHTRTRMRGHTLSSTHNIRDADHGRGARSLAATLAPARVVKAWARGQGISVPVRGRPKSEVYAAYAAAVLAS